MEFHTVCYNIYNLNILLIIGGIMFTSIKMHLYRWGIIKLTNLIDRVEYIKNYNIDPYGMHSDITLVVVTDNILDYTEELRKINNTNLMDDYAIVKPITENLVKSVELNTWFSDGVYMVPDVNQAYLMWLNEVLILLTKYELMKANIHSGKFNGNSIKIRPYIINVEKIVGIIFKQCVT